LKPRAVAVGSAVESSIAATKRYEGAPAGVVVEPTVQMIDVNVPTTDGRELTLTRYTQPEPELKLLLQKLKLTLPAQPPPKITAAELARTTAV
jgi:hypothetical protein